MPVLPLRCSDHAPPSVPPSDNVLQISGNRPVPSPSIQESIYFRTGQQTSDEVHMIREPCLSKTRGNPEHPHVLLVDRLRRLPRSALRKLRGVQRTVDLGNPSSIHVPRSQARHCKLLNAFVPRSDELVEHVIGRLLVPLILNMMGNLIKNRTTSIAILNGMKCWTSERSAISVALMVFAEFFQVCRHDCRQSRLSCSIRPGTRQAHSAYRREHNHRLGTRHVSPPTDGGSRSVSFSMHDTNLLLMQTNPAYPRRSHQVLRPFPGCRVIGDSVPTTQSECMP